MVPRMILLTALLALSACGGGKNYNSEAPQVQKGVYKYNPNARHAPVNLSGSELSGIKRDVL